MKVKTFTSELKIFETIGELHDLDEQVNKFVVDSNLKKIISVSDTCTTGVAGETIGIIRVVAYK